MEPNLEHVAAWMEDVYNLLTDMRDSLNDIRNTVDAIEAKDRS